MKPEEAMRLALREARRGEGRTHPNPPVGAVVFRGEVVLGRGSTRPVGGPHAEVVALERAERNHGRAKLRGASMAVTLEPCCHVGRTGPCTERIIESGLRRVFVGHRDPHPGVSGLGIRALRRAGIGVEVGIREDECREQHRGFLSVWERKRPFTLLKLASSLDGRIATASGESRWITGEAARRKVHRLRSRVDAVVVGSATARRDDPELTARLGDRVVHRPVRIVIDSRLRAPGTLRLFVDRPERTWVVCGPDAPARRRAAHERRGVRVIEVRMRGDHLDLPAVAKKLAREGLTQILLEGGGELAAAWLRGRLVDEVHWFVAPRLLGGDGRAALGALELDALSATPWLDAEVRRVGGDVYIRSDVRYPARRRTAKR